MLPITHHLTVEIVRFTDDSFPSWVAAEFVDAEGRRHTIVDKVPILSLEMLDSSSDYPRPGFAACALLSRWKDAGGRELARISTGTSCWIESTEGLSEFVVLSQQLTAVTQEVRTK